MLLHLVRHAHALNEEEDRTRPLSPRGRAELARLARFLGACGVFQPAQVWHSPLVRSRQTADDLVARLLLVDAVVVEIPGLLPEDDPHELAERLQLHPKDRGAVALVGHEPHLSALASLLVRGKAHPALFNLKKSALLTLEATGGFHKKTGQTRWRVRWQLSPELLPPPPSAPGAPGPAPGPAPSAPSGAPGAPALAPATPEPLVNQ
jgi:phosphohistidine phosphatase